MAREEMFKAQETLHKHAFWLYGTIAALAIKEALSVVVPHVLSFVSPDANVAPSYDRTLLAAELLRLFVFLVVIVRFYVGSAFFFESVHVDKKSVKPIEPQEYAKDFLSGLLHFVLFFVWSFSIDTLTRAQWLFPVILCGILTFDLLWLFLCGHIRQNPLLIFWTALNVVTVISGVIVYVATLLFWPTHPLFGEEVFLVLVLLASMEDLRVMLTHADSSSWKLVKSLYEAYERLRRREAPEGSQG